MGRIPQPREKAALMGSIKKNPQRYKNEPIKSNKPLGQPPARMSAAAKAAWIEIEQNVYNGILTNADRFPMEQLANLLAEYWNDPVEFTAAKHKILQNICAKFGMDPASRQKLSVEKPKEDENEFGDFPTAH